MLRLSPQDRLSITDVRNHPWLRASERLVAAANYEHPVELHWPTDLPPQPSTGMDSVGSVESDFWDADDQEDFHFPDGGD